MMRRIGSSAPGHTRRSTFQEKKKKTRGRQLRWRVISADSCSVYFSSCDNWSVNSHEMWSDRDQSGVSLNSSLQQHIMIFTVHELSLLMITPLDFVTV